MAKNYAFSMSEWRYQFLKWVNNECQPSSQEAIFNAHSGFLRAVRSLEEDKFIIWADDTNGKAMNEIYKITARGRAMLDVIELESGERD